MKVYNKVVLWVLTILILLVLVGLVYTDFIPNFGWECGYYGQYNRVRHVIEDMPNVRIVRDMQHHDVTLEDFGFLLEVDDGNGESRPVVMIFSESTPEIAERNKGRIREIIQKEIDSQKDGPKRIGYFGFSYENEE